MAIHLLAEIEKDPSSPYWKMPLSFARDGRTILSICEAIAFKSNVLPIDELSPEQLREVIVARAKFCVVENIRTQFAGPQGNARSAEKVLGELLADSPMGRRIANIERKFMAQFYEEIQAISPPDR
jgi:hypothetical protein